MSASDFFLGVDGGGTQTTCLLINHEGAEIARRTTSATNPNVVTLKVAAERLMQVVEEACREAGCSPADLRGVVFGLAGGGSGENKSMLEHALREHFGEAFPLQVETDARIALEGAFQGKPGIVVVAGTGSVIIGKSSKNEICRVGGWGRPLGDEGSGYYLGVEGVRAFTKLLDGMAESPLISRLFSERLGWTSRDHLITSVYNKKLDLATLAPLVLELAAKSDPLAQEIVYRGIQALTEQILAVRERIGMASVRVATMGGLIDKPTMYREALVVALRDADRSMEVCMPEKSSVEGAAMMARAGIGR